MLENSLILSSWITSGLLVSVAWFTYKYSKNFLVEVNHWKYISSGVIFLAASELARPMFVFAKHFFWAYWVLSAIGGILISYGFYRLYSEERV